MNISSVVSVVVFAGVFFFSRSATRRFLESWAELDGIALWGASFVVSLALAVLASGAALYLLGLIRGGD